MIDTEGDMACPQCKSPYLIVRGMVLTCSCGYKIDLYELQRENEELKKENSRLLEKLRLMEHA